MKYLNFSLYLIFFYCFLEAALAQQSMQNPSQDNQKLSQDNSPSVGFTKTANYKRLLNKLAPISNNNSFIARNEEDKLTELANSIDLFADITHFMDVRLRNSVFNGAPNIIEPNLPRMKKGNEYIATSFRVPLLGENVFLRSGIIIGGVLESEAQEKISDALLKGELNDMISVGNYMPEVGVETDLGRKKRTKIGVMVGPNKQTLSPVQLNPSQFLQNNLISVKAAIVF
jgi:hypothetical protein